MDSRYLSMEIEKLKEIIAKILEFFEIYEPEITVEEKDGGFRAAIRVLDAGLLIGKDGEVLLSLEQLLKSIVNKQQTEFKHFTLDINNYRLQKEGYIREMAQKAGRHAMITKKEVFLPPMNSYERRLVHLELSINPDIATESIGQGLERRIVIKPR